MISASGKENIRVNGWIGWLPSSYMNNDADELGSGNGVGSSSGISLPNYFRKLSAPGTTKKNPLSRYQLRIVLAQLICLRPAFGM